MQCLVSLGCLNLALKKLHNDTRNFFARDCAIYDKLLLSLGAALFLPLEMNSIVQKRNSNKFINRLITLWLHYIALISQQPLFLEAGRFSVERIYNLVQSNFLLLLILWEHNSNQIVLRNLIQHLRNFFLLIPWINYLIWKRFRDFWELLGNIWDNLKSFWCSIRCSPESTAFKIIFFKDRLYRKFGNFSWMLLNAE